MFGYYLQLAWRHACKAPLTTVLIIVTMAIGTGACVTALTIFTALSGEPLPGISNHLYVVTLNEHARGGSDGYAHTLPDSLLKLRDARALVNAKQASTQVALAKTLTRVENPNGKQAQTVNGLLADGPVLRELGVPLLFGRPWTAAEQAAHKPVAVIDSQLAMALFGTADAVGRSIDMHHHLFRIIGVTAPWKPRTTFIDASKNDGPGQNMQLFVPVGTALDAGIGPRQSGECGRSAANKTFGSVDVKKCRWLEVWVALKSPAAANAYRQFLANYASVQHADGRFRKTPRTGLYRTRVWITLNHVIPSDVSLNVFLAGGFLVLCMINVAGLLTARFCANRPTPPSAARWAPRGGRCSPSIWSRPAVSAWPAACWLFH